MAHVFSAVTLPYWFAIACRRQSSFLVVHFLGGQTEQSYRRHEKHEIVELGDGQYRYTHRPTHVDLLHCESTRFLRHLNEPQQRDGEGWASWRTGRWFISRCQLYIRLICRHTILTGGFRLPSTSRVACSNRVDSREVVQRRLSWRAPKA